MGGRTLYFKPIHIDSFFSIVEHQNLYLSIILFSQFFNSQTQKKPHLPLLAEPLLSQTHMVSLCSQSNSLQFGKMGKIINVHNLTLKNSIKYLKLKLKNISFLTLLNCGE